MKTQLLPPVRVTEEQRKYLESEAKKEDRSLSNYIRYHLFKDVPVNHK